MENRFSDDTVTFVSATADHPSVFFVSVYDLFRHQFGVEYVDTDQASREDLLRDWLANHTPSDALVFSIEDHGFANLLTSRRPHLTTVA